MKQVVFLKHLSFFEAETKDLDERLSEDKLKELYDDLGQVFEKHGIALKSYETVQLPMKKLAIKHCEVCTQLMVNREENPTKFDESCVFFDHDDLCLDGGTHNGRDLCEECLPVEHRWGHYS